MAISLEPQIAGKIDAEEVHIGKGVVIEESVLITGKGGPARKVVLGDFTYIGRHTRIICPEFCLGDYSKINAFSFANGEKPLQIGRNCWFGGNCVFDAIGGLDIDDNVGIGAHSQIWTHIQFGDIVEGSRFYSRKYMLLGKDSWFVGHCIVSPVRVGEKSMAMVGSVVTRDMLPNHIYAGVPAKDVTDKMGYQFETRTVEQKAVKLQEMIDAFVSTHPEYRGQLMVARSPEERREGVCCFDVSQRTYTKNYGEAEIAFLKANVPLVKFAPEGEGPFFTPQQQVEPFGDEAGARDDGR
ncbi:MAG TPA: acyltransferase [Chloroflexia bacterium]|nr:acyltransferase [Chloroflexia bacterium]